MHGISPAVGGWGGDKIGGVGRLLGFAEKPSITNGKKHVELDNTKKVISVILAPTDLCQPLIEQLRVRRGVKKILRGTNSGGPRGIHEVQFV